MRSFYANATGSFELSTAEERDEKHDGINEGRERRREGGREKRLVRYRREPMSLHLEPDSRRHARSPHESWREEEREREGERGGCSPSARLIN